MTCNTFNNQTAKYSVSALTQEQLNNELYSFEQLYNMQLDPSLQYDQELIYTTVSLTKGALTAVDPSGTLYPLVWDRFNQGPILAPEYADFLNFSQYDLVTVNANLNSFLSTSVFNLTQYSTTSANGITNLSPVTVNANTVVSSTQLDTTQVTSNANSFSTLSFVSITQYFEQLDLYYNSNFAATLSGGFCSAFSGKLLAISGLISGAVSLINQLKNFSLGDIIGRLTSIKTILLKLVDSLKEKLLQQITNIVNKVNNFKNMIMSTAAAIGKKIQQAKNFFSDLNINNIKAKIEEIIARMAGGYEDITPDVIAYVLFRLCRLTEILNAFMKSPVDALKNVMNNFVYQQTLFTNFSLNATAAAIDAGHFRKDPFDIIAEREAAAQAGNNSGMAAYISRPFNAAEMQMANELRSATIEQIKSSSFTAAQYITFADDIITRADPIEWQGVTAGTYMRLFRVAKRLGTSFRINSALRPPKLNDAVDGKKNSLHLSGQALDVSMRGRSNEFRVNFIRAASEEGFNGIGTYPTFIHVDTRGSEEIWGSYNAEALALHKNGSYRKAIYKRVNNSAPQ